LKLQVETVDYHTGGEPFRIVVAGVPPIPGDTILDKRRYAREHLDEIRKLLVHEPRGHADMYGCFVTEPEDGGADVGVVFFHNEGYSTACGHGTIALVTYLIEGGIVQGDRVVVDAPSGRLEAWTRLDGGDVTSVRFRNVPSFVHSRGLRAAGRDVDVAFGGAFYASLEERSSLASCRA
jgi:proline racemase